MWRHPIHTTQRKCRKEGCAIRWVRATERVGPSWGDVDGDRNDSGAAETGDRVGGRAAQYVAEGWHQNAVGYDEDGTRGTRRQRLARYEDEVAREAFPMPQ